MPNHALQWAAMSWAKAEGATRYDLWGIPDEIGQVALGMAAGRGHPVLADELPVDINRFPEEGLWGVFRFKQGFGGHVERFVGAWDMPLSGIGYAAYRGAWCVKSMAEWRNGGMRELRNSGMAEWREGADPSRFAPGSRYESETAPTLLDQRPTHHAQSPISNTQYPIPTPAEWRSALATLPAPHILQSWEWGELKAQTGWSAHRFGLKDGSGRVRAAWQLLIRRPAPGLPVGIGYVPKGPVLDWTDDALAAEVLGRIESQSWRMGCLFVKIDPDVTEESQAGRRLLALLRQRGWRFSAQQIQFKNTAFTDLRPDPEILLGAMKSKWRYNIRLAERRGIHVRQGGAEDLAGFYRLYAQTGERDGFLVRPEAYYSQVCRTLLQAQEDGANPLGGALLLAEHPEEREPLAGLFLFRYGEHCWYFYGASSDLRRRDMPNYLLQWEALQWAKAQGCTLYDWWGAPTRLDDPDDPMQGVWRFKEGFNAQFQNHVGAWDWNVSHVVRDSLGA
jgi:lipid II:glycine glycyltransferase (peptidoglycan interpeptide bridge formation enzyme)